MGGAETLVFNILKKIDRKKYQFVFLCTTNRRGVYEERIRKLGGEIYHSKPRKTIIGKYLMLTKFMKEHQIDVVHAPLMFFSGIICIAAKRAKVKKIIVHSHNAGDLTDKSPLRKAYQKLMRKLINKYSDVKIACGNKAAKYLFGENTNGVLILKNGIDLEKFAKVNEKNIAEFKNKYNISDKRFNICNIGRLSPQKNQVFLIEIAKYIKDNGIKSKIYIAGDGPLKDSLNDIIRKQELKEQIQLIGPQDDIPACLKVMDAMMMPSLHEGLPISAIEAQASGLPCILSNNIDKDVCLVKKITKMLETNNPAEWYKEALILSKTKPTLKKCQEEIKNKDYDITKTTRIMEEIYNCKNG